MLKCDAQIFCKAHVEKVCDNAPFTNIIQAHCERVHLLQSCIIGPIDCNGEWLSVHGINESELEMGARHPLTKHVGIVVADV